MEPPYLLFLGDVDDRLAAKTAFGILEWRRDWCRGQLRLPGCAADVDLPDLTLAEAIDAGVKTLVIAVANSGGTLAEHWVPTLVEAVEAGLDIASGLHQRLVDTPEVHEGRRGAAAGACSTSATRRGRFKTGTGVRAAGPAAADRRHRLQLWQEIHRARDRT